MRSTPMHPDAQKAFIEAGHHTDDSPFVFKNDKDQVLSPRRHAEKARMGDRWNTHAALRLRQSRPALKPLDTRSVPSDSVSAIMWACDTETRSSAPKYRPTFI
jgi:hypothetical protein